MGKIYVVATPIGNLEDITLRALRILKEVDFIACEDTRVTIKLLNHFNIKKPLISFYQHSKISKVNKLLDLLSEGKDIALVADAGTPGIADPGCKLISEAVKANIEVISIPGPSALIAALSVSGFPADQFLFLGFLPQKKGRQKKLQELTKEKRTIVFYESPHRIQKLLPELKDYFGDQEILVCRELTKKFETIYRGKISEVLVKVKPKGEFVVIIKNQNVKK